MAMSRQAKTARRGRQVASAPIELFQGYDSVTGLGLSTALGGSTGHRGASTEEHYQVCEDMSELAQALEINQSLSVGLGPIGDIDEKMKFLHNLNATAHSISIVVYARNTLGTDTATNVHLLPEAAQVLKDGIAAFVLGYGDSYLSACTRGGEYYAVYTFYSQTREEKTELEVDMKAQGLFDVVKVDASLQVKINNFTSSTKTRVSLEQHISGISHPALPSADKIIEFAQNFSTLKLDAPTVIRFETTGYEHVPKLGTFQPIPRNRRFFVGNGVVDGLTASLVRVKQLQNQIRWLQGIHAFYGGHVDARLAEVAKEVEADLKAIGGLMEEWEDEPTGSFTAPKLASLDAGYPSLAYEVKRSTPYGGSDANAFDDLDIPAALSRRTRIASVQIASGTSVDNLRVVYQSDAGTPRTVDHGGSGGRWSALPLQPGQYVTVLAGRAGLRVDKLAITITGGSKIEGGGSGGGDFTWPVPANSFVIGFAGRATREYLEQIQAVCVELQPAKWTK